MRTRPHQAREAARLTCGVSVMKNCEPFVFAPALALKKHHTCNVGKLFYSGSVHSSRRVLRPASSVLGVLRKCISNRDFWHHFDRPKPRDIVMCSEYTGHAHGVRAIMPQRWVELIFKLPTPDGFAARAVTEGAPRLDHEACTRARHTFRQRGE